jgi:hypothetical protein
VSGGWLAHQRLTGDPAFGDEFWLRFHGSSFLLMPCFIHSTVSAFP